MQDILGSDIIPLPVNLGWVMEGEKHTVGPEVDFLRIIYHLHYFGVSGFFCTDLFI